MTTLVTLDQLAHLAPNIRSGYREAFQGAQPILDRYEISRTPLRMAHFMAQVLHESGGLTIQFENLNYSPARLPVVWPKRFRPQGPLDPAAYAHDPEKLGNEVYGGRMGNTDPGDGFKYRGRGLLQLTGKDSYREATTAIQTLGGATPDFVQEPDEVVDASWCVAVAASEWFAKGCNALADQDSIRKVTLAINGGLVGLAERTDWTTKTKAVWH